MAKFQVVVMRNIQREQVVEVLLTRDQVVEECGLEGQERADWRDHVQEVLESDTGLLDEAKILSSDEVDFGDADVLHVDEV